MKDNDVDFGREQTEQRDVGGQRDGDAKCGHLNLEERESLCLVKESVNKKHIVVQESDNWKLPIWKSMTSRNAKDPSNWTNPEY